MNVQRKEILRSLVLFVLTFFSVFCVYGYQRIGGDPFNELEVAQQSFAFSTALLSILLCHEMGHYLVGKWCGIGVETFSIGMGKQIWGRYDKSGTLWRVALFPVGGYVKFKGDEDLSGKRDKSISIKQSELIRIDIEKKQLLLELKILREG